MILCFVNLKLLENLKNTQSPNALIWYLLILYTCRSDCVFTIHVGQKSNGESAEKGIRSKITLVDMAGMDSVESFDLENTRKKNGR